MAVVGLLVFVADHWQSLRPPNACCIARVVPRIPTEDRVHIHWKRPFSGQRSRNETWSEGLHNRANGCWAEAPPGVRLRFGSNSNRDQHRQEDQSMLADTGSCAKTPSHRFFGKRLLGVLVLSSTDYLRSRQKGVAVGYKSASCKNPVFFRFCCHFSGGTPALPMAEFHGGKKKKVSGTLIAIERLRSIAR